jgi:hypothetical protein
MATGLLESDRCKSGVEMAAGNVGLVQLVTAACAEEKPRLAVADELNQQLRHAPKRTRRSPGTSQKSISESR